VGSLRISRHSMCAIACLAVAPVARGMFTSVRLRRHLDRAIRKSNVKLVQKLLAGGVDIHTPARKRHDTPLHRASEFGNTQIVDLLIQAGARLNGTDEHGRRPLHVAAYWASHDSASLLITHGADPELHDDDQHSPLHAGATSSWLPATTMRLLLEAGASIEDSEKPLRWHR